MGTPMTPESALCTACGLCCSGGLFNFAKVAEGEEERLVAEGFRMTWAGEKRGFALPCHKLEDRCCGYYEGRPAVCRSYRCVTLMELQDGTIDAGEAHRRVAATLEAVDKVRESVPVPDGHLMETLCNLLAEGASVPPQALLRIGVLNLLLDRYFRKDRQRVLNGGDGVEGQESPVQAPASGASLSPGSTAAA